MAQRFGGKYSPQTNNEDRSAVSSNYKAAIVDPVGARANLMFVPAAVLLFTSLFQGALGLATGLVGAGTLALGAWLLRGGLQAEAGYLSRKVARRPAFPRKITAAGVAGVGIGIGALSQDNGIFAALIFGAATTALHLAAFGFDPLTNKGMEGIDSFQQDRVARVVDEAEAHLKAMTLALNRVGDRQISDRLALFQTAVRKLIRTVEEDPRDLTGARKYLGVYLLGARDASIKFADIYSQNQSASARADYLELLDDLDRNFAAKTDKLLLDDHSDLTVEIEVLRDRLDREGVRLDQL